MAINAKDYPIIIRENLKANEECTKFFYTFIHNGKKKRGLIDLSKKDWNKKDRIRYAERTLEEEKERFENNIDSDSTVNDMVNLYLEKLEDGQYKRDITSYYNRNVKSKIGSRRACDILPHDIQKIVDAMIKKGNAPATARQVISILSPAFKIARANKIMLHNPCETVAIKIPRQKKIVTNATERLRILFEAILSIYANDPFYRAFFLLALQGRRRGEIFDLTVDDIVLDMDYYIIRDTKNGEDQKIYLPPLAKQAIMEFMPKEGILFRSRVTGERMNDIRKQVAKIKRHVGDWFSMHYTRNLIVSAMAEQGVDSIHLSGALGHNDPNTITKYLSLNYAIGSKIASDVIDNASK